MQNLRPVVVVVRKRGSSLPAARVGSSVLPSSCARVLSYWGGIAFAVGGIGFFPFYKAAFSSTSAFWFIHRDWGRQGAGDRYAACTWLFLVAMWTLKRLGEGIFSQFGHDRCPAVYFPLPQALVAAFALRVRH